MAGSSDQSDLPCSYLYQYDTVLATIKTDFLRDRISRKIYKPAEIIAKLRQVEILTSQGKAVIDAIGVTDATYYRWRQEYGGLKVDQVKRLKEREAEKGRLRGAVSDLTLETLVLKEAASGNV